MSKNPTPLSQGADQKMTTFSADHHNTTQPPKRDHMYSCGSPNKMLASTMQLTNNNPHHTTTHHHSHELQHGRQQQPHTPHTHNNKLIVNTQSMDPVVPGPNSVPNNQPEPPPPETFHTPKKRAVLTPSSTRNQSLHAPSPSSPTGPTQDQQARRFVDVPPMSNSPTHERGCNEPFFLTTTPQPHRTAEHSGKSSLERR